MAGSDSVTRPSRESGGGSGRTPVAERSNPVHAFGGAALRAIERLSSAPAWAMTPSEQAEALAELDELASRVAELRLRVLAAADRNQVGGKDGHASTASWLAAETRQTRARCHRDLRTGLALDEPALEPLRAAFAAGQVNPEQVRVILRAMDDLDAEEVDPEERSRGLRHLIGEARRHDAKQLRLLAGKLFEVVAPGEAEQREAAALEREERRALRRTRFAMRDNHDGTTSGWFTLPTAHAEMLGKAVQAFTAPRRRNPQAWVDDQGTKVPYPRLLGQGLCDLVEHLPTDKLPQAGGLAATVVITLSLEQLRSGLGSAALDTGSRLSPGEVRRLACNSGLVPAVLGSKSQPLDLDRVARLHNPAQRTALVLRDGGCTAQGCDRPPAWTEVHHDLAWAHGGATDLDNGRLLCPFHHRLAHDDRYDMRRLPDGKVRFTRRT